jgi:3-deoxy-D-manno-octulosonic acid (KDO) 8-phosphate synthase
MRLILKWGELGSICADSVFKVSFVKELYSSYHGDRGPVVTVSIRAIRNKNKETDVNGIADD